ncbi:hypothetical protein [Nocardioides alkalitolerans]|uniref:hypothetical protein n=1 Tax=Nocardioides alkalitolerans TaxID=281714 RepID=UPI0004120C79|nr:hypothetical protein [Nocardioides alkalitolerans]
MSERAAPYHCPYCADEDLRPHEVVDAGTGEVSSPPGAWECRSCLRAFTVKMIGRLRRPESVRKGAPA